MPHALLGPPCEAFLERIDNVELTGYTSAHVVSDTAHRLMTLEANMLWGWPVAGMVHRLKRHPAEVQQLARYRQAIDEITAIGIQVLDISGRLVSLAADVSRQFGLLSSDALIVSVMRHHGLTHLASNDPDFDRVPGITRYAPS
jgi:predicted nucleic acid-binding protein